MLPSQQFWFRFHWLLCLAVILYHIRETSSQETSDGYPRLFTQYRSMRKAENSFVQFQNQIDFASQYMVSYSYEMYIKLVPSSQGQSTYSATLIDCSPFIQVNISSTQISFRQFNGEQLNYLFNSSSSEFATQYLNKWNHLAFSYNNYSDSLNMQMSMRIYSNGALLTSKRVYTPATTSDLSIGRTLCYFGNTQSNVQLILKAATGVDKTATLNADLGYLVVSSVPRQASFAASVFHQYPSPSASNLIYFRFDADDDGYSGAGQDFYYNRTVSQFKWGGVPMVYDENKTGICECYGKPMRVYQMQRARQAISSQPITLSTLDTISSSFTLDFWILIQADLEYPSSTSSPQRLLFFSDKFLKVGATSKNLMISVGDTSVYTSVSGVLYYRKWIYVAIQLKTNRNVNVFVNSLKAATIAQQGTIKQTSTTSFQVRHEVTMKLWRFRLLNSASNSLTDSFFQFTYLQGSNSQTYVAQTTLDASMVVFDFKLEETELANFTSQSNSLVDGQFNYTNSRNITYSWAFASGSFMADVTTCGEDPEYIDGVCSDHRWYPVFTYERKALNGLSNINNTQAPSTPTFTGQIQSLASQMTIEFWFKFNQPSLSNTSYLLQMGDSNNNAERFKAALTFNANSNNHTLTVGTSESNSSLLQFPSQLSPNKWYHLAWQTDYLVPIQKAILYDQTLYASFVSKAIANNSTLPEVTDASSYQSNNGSLALLFQAFATTTVGNTQTGDRPLLGQMRELRFWNEFRNEQSQISVMRNLEISAGGSNRTQLAYYYRMVAQENLLQLKNMGVGSNGDLSLSSQRQVNSPLRMQQDFDLLICPYGNYLSQDTLNCVVPSTPQINLISYLDVNRNVAILDSQAVFPKKDQNQFSIAFNLFTTSPFSSLVLASTVSNFNLSSSATKMEVDMSKVSSAYKYQLQLRVTNKVYQSSYDQFFYQWLDPSCPSFSAVSASPSDSQVYIYKKVNSSITVALQNNTYCLFQQSFFNKSSIAYSWALANTTPSSANITKSISFSSSGQSLSFAQTGDIPTPSVITWNISLKYNNTLLKGMQTHTQLLNFVITSDSINIIYEKSSLTVLNGTNFLLNVTNSYIINQAYSGKTIVFNAICPQSLFVSALAYSETCFITQSQKAMLIPTNNYLQKMNVVPYLPYNFTIQAYVDGAKATTLVQKSINVSWATLTVVGQEGSSNYQPCPVVNLASSASITNKVSQIKVMPEYRLTCQVSDSVINYYSIASVDWSMDSSNVSYFQSDTWQNNVLQQYIQNSKSSDTSSTTDLTVLQSQLDYQLLDSFLRRQYFISLQDSNYWLYVASNAPLKLLYGESIILTAKFILTPSDSSSPNTIIQTRSINLTQISQQLKIYLTTNSPPGYASYKFLYSDNVTLNFSSSYDPDDPSTKLKANWTCPLNSLNQTASFCPNQSADLVLTISTLQRVQAGWQYEVNQTFSLVIYNPKSGRFSDPVNVSVYLIYPDLGGNISACPYLNFTGTNAAIWNSSLNVSNLCFSNNITSKDFQLSQPVINLSCQYQTSSIVYDYFALQVSDQQGVLIPKVNSLFIPSFNSKTPSFNFSQSLLNSLDLSQKYNLTFLLWFRKVGAQVLQLQTHTLVVTRQVVVNSLVAQFSQATYNLLPWETALLDASQSYDNVNMFNRNFSYSWTCPQAITNLSSCPKYSESKVSVTPTLRNATQTNVPGRIYRFNVSTYDNIRRSNGAQTSILIAPPNSPNRECVYLNFTNVEGLSCNISQDFVYPMVYSLQTQVYCTNTSIAQKSSSISKFNPSYQNISLASYMGMDQNLFTLAVQSQNSGSQSQTSAQNYSMQLSQQFIVANDYTNTTQALRNLTVVKSAQTQIGLGFYISGPSVVNIEKQTAGLTLQVLSQDPTINISNASIKWICDSSMYLSAQSLCSNQSSSIFNFKISDLGYSVYKTYFENKIFKFTANITTSTSQQQATMFVNFNSMNLTLYPENCQIQSSQLSGNLNISQQLSFALICNSSEQDYLDSLGVTYQWSIVGVPSGFLDNSMVINISDSSRIMKLKPYALQQYTTYSVKMVVTFPSIFSYPNLLYMQQYNTSSANYALLLNNLSSAQASGGYQMSPSYGYFYQTEFNLTLTLSAFFKGNQQLQTLFSGYLNLFVQLRIYDSTLGLWYSVLPFQYFSKTLTSIRLPVYSKLYLDVINNLGQTVSYPLSVTIYNDQNAVETALLAIITARLTALNLTAVDPWIPLLELFQYMQLVSRLNKIYLGKASSSDLQIQYQLGLPLNDAQTYLQFMADNLQSVSQYLSKSSSLYCFIGATCIRIKQNSLMLCLFVFEMGFRANELQVKQGSNTTKTDLLMGQARDLIIFFLDDLEILTTDLNQNIADKTSSMISYFSADSRSSAETVAKLNSISYLIKQYKIAALAPGESATYGGDASNFTGGVFKLPLNKDFVYNSSDLNIYIPKFIINALSVQNSPYIPLTLSIQSLQANSSAYQDSSTQVIATNSNPTNSTAINQTVKTSFNVTYMTGLIVDLQLQNSRGASISYDRDDFISDNNTYQGTFITLDFKNQFAQNNTEPSWKQRQGAMCVYQESDTSSLAKWFADGLITQQFNQSVNSRTLCSTPHLTKFTVIFNSSYTLEDQYTHNGGSGSDGGLVPGLQGVLAGNYSYRYYIFVIVLVLLFLFVSALTYYNHFQRFKREKGLDEGPSNLHVITSENLVANELGDLRYSYSINRRLLYRQIYMLSSTLGILFVLLKYSSLALRAQVFFLQSFVFSVIGTIYFRLKSTEYQLVPVANSGSIIVDSAVLAILIYLVLLLPWRMITNKLYSRFKPEYFRTKTHSLSRSSSSSLPSDYYSNNFQSRSRDHQAQLNQQSNNNDSGQDSMESQSPPANSPVVEKHLKISQSQNLKGSRMNSSKTLKFNQTDDLNSGETHQKQNDNHLRPKTPNTAMQQRQNDEAIDFDCDQNQALDFDDGGYPQDSKQYGAQSLSSSHQKSAAYNYENGEYFSSTKKAADGPGDKFVQSLGLNQSEKTQSRQVQQQTHQFEGGESEQNISSMQSAQDMSAIGRSQNDKSDSRIQSEPPLIGNFINAQDRLARSQNSNTHSLNASVIKAQTNTTNLQNSQIAQSTLSPNNYLKNLKLQQSQSSKPQGIQFYGSQSNGQEEESKSQGLEDAMSLTEAKRRRRAKEYQLQNQAEATNQPQNFMRQTAVSNRPTVFNDEEITQPNNQKSQGAFATYNQQMPAPLYIEENDLNYEDLEDMRASQRSQKSWDMNAIKQKHTRNAYQKTESAEEGVDASLESQDNEYRVVGPTQHLKSSLMSISSFSSKKQNTQYKAVAREEDFKAGDQEKFYTFRVQSVSSQPIERPTAARHTDENVSTSNRVGLAQLPNSSQKINNYDAIKLIDHIETQHSQSKERQSAFCLQLGTKESVSGPNLNFVYSPNAQRLKDQRLDIADLQSASNVSKLQPQNKAQRLRARQVATEYAGDAVEDAEEEEKKFTQDIRQGHSTRNANHSYEKNINRRLFNTEGIDGDKGQSQQSVSILRESLVGVTNQVGLSKRASVLLLDGDTPDKRRMEHLDLESMHTEQTQHQYFEQDETQRSFDQEHQHKELQKLCLEEFDEETNLAWILEESKHSFTLNKLAAGHTIKPTMTKHLRESSSGTFIEIYEERDDEMRSSQLLPQEINRQSFGVVQAGIEEQLKASSKKLENPLQSQSKQSKNSQKQEQDLQKEVQDSPSKDQNDGIRFLQRKAQLTRELGRIILGLFLTNCLLLALSCYFGAYTTVQNMISFLIYLVILFILGSLIALAKTMIICKNVILKGGEPIYSSQYLNGRSYKILRWLLIGDEISSYALTLVQNNKQLFSKQRIIIREVMEMVDQNNYNSSDRPLNQISQSGPTDNNTTYLKNMVGHPDIMAQNQSQDSPSAEGEQFTKRTDMALNHNELPLAKNQAKYPNQIFKKGGKRSTYQSSGFQGARSQLQQREGDSENQRDLRVNIEHNQGLSKSQYYDQKQLKAQRIKTTHQYQSKN